jgi:hypothetical protein
MAQAPKLVRSAFAAVPEGSFVQLQNCTVDLPSYVQLMQAAESPGFAWSNPLGVRGASFNGINDPSEAIQMAELIAGRIKGVGGSAAVRSAPGVRVAHEVKHLDVALRTLIKTAGSNPRVPMATCDGNNDVAIPRGVDLLFPLQLANFTPEPGLISRPFTLVGKLILKVRGDNSEYVDTESLSTFSSALAQIDQNDRTAVEGPIPPDKERSYLAELYADVVVLPPGAVIIPIAIYR